MAIVSRDRVYGSHEPCANCGDDCPSLMFEVTHDAPVSPWTRAPGARPFAGDPCKELLCPDCMDLVVANERNR